MPVGDTKELKARCRLLASELEKIGFMEHQDKLIAIANSLPDNGRTATAQAYVPPMPTNMPYQYRPLADVGTEENPRPSIDEILERTPESGSKLDPKRNEHPSESDVRKWTVQISDIPSSDEEDLKSMVMPFVDEIGGLLSDYKEESPRTKKNK